MATVRHNPITAFYRALSPLGRWPRWLLIGILLYSLVAATVFVAYALVISYPLTGPATAALTATIHNFLFLWAIVFVPAAILMLVLLGLRLRIWRLWSGRLLYAGMIGTFAGALCICVSINTIFPTPLLLGRWGMVFLTASADVAVLGLILLLGGAWRRWTTWLWIVALVGFMLSASYHAIVTVAPILGNPEILQAASIVQSLCYILGLLSVVIVHLKNFKAVQARRERSQSSLL